MRVVFESRDYERNIFVGNVQGHRLHDIFPGIAGSPNAVNDAVKAEKAERKRQQGRLKVVKRKANCARVCPW